MSAEQNNKALIRIVIVFAVIIICLLVAVKVKAADQTVFQWDYSAEDQQFLIDEAGGFQLYVSKTQGGPYEPIGGLIPPIDRVYTADTSELRGRNYFVIRAWIPTDESTDSNIVSAPFKPETPANFRQQ